ncbi:MAG: efflux RND transporter periplasmic adaptor subunit [Betaproteobacteria bacterium HGW-Betaproteobacteria-12]|nr:MAG: efflux RND transporter periplasmic adaptor subunit [Betaproteobacteria bacterium HGW-Betaproteobacteria-12]
MIGTFEQARVSCRLTVRTAIVLAFATVLSACGEKSLPQQKPHPVLVVTTHNVSGGYERTFTGVVRARHESEQGFRTGGKVVARMVEVGQSVVAGQPLAHLDSADYELAVRAAEEQLQTMRVDAEQAASDEARFRRLLADNSVAIADHERQKARADAAAARQAQASHQLELARNRAKYTTLVAEFDGVITAVRFEAGQIVTEGQPIVTIVKPSELEVVADLPEEMAGSAHSLSASASFWDAPGLAVQLKLRELSPAAAAQTRTFRARFSILDKSPALQLGMTAKLHLAAKDAEPAAVLPATAIWKTNGTSMVWQVASGGSKLVAQPVEVIRYTDEAVLVRGLPDGTKVVTAGIQKLTPGLEVVAVERSASGMNLGMAPVQAATASAPGSRL